MKIASNVNKIRLSPAEWEAIGQKSGWTTPKVFGVAIYSQCQSCKKDYDSLGKTSDTDFKLCPDCLSALETDYRELFGTSSLNFNEMQHNAIAAMTGEEDENIFNCNRDNSLNRAFDSWLYSPYL